MRARCACGSDTAGAMGCWCATGGGLHVSRGGHLGQRVRLRGSMPGPMAGQTRLREKIGCNLLHRRFCASPLGWMSRVPSPRKSITRPGGGVFSSWLCDEFLGTCGIYPSGLHGDADAGRLHPIVFPRLHGGRTGLAVSQQAQLVVGAKSHSGPGEASRLKASCSLRWVTFISR